MIWSDHAGKKTQMEMSENGPGRKHSLPKGLCNGMPSAESKKLTALVYFFCGSFSLYKWGIGNYCATGQEHVPATTAAPKLEE